MEGRNEALCKLLPFNESRAKLLATPHETGDTHTETDTYMHDEVGDAGLYTKINVKL